MERVVRRLARPHQIPERVTELRGEAAAGGGEELREERRAAGCEDLAQAIVDGSVGPRLGRRSEQREMLREEQRDLAVARPERAPAHPHELARCQQRVEVPRVVAPHARREDPRLEIRRRHERAFELRDRLEERGLAALGRVEAVPGRGEAAEGVLLDRLDLAAQTRQRSPAERAQHPRVDPLRAGLPRPELPLHDRSGFGETTQRVDDRCLGKTETSRRVAGDERTVGAGVSPQQGCERIEVIVRQERRG